MWVSKKEYQLLIELKQAAEHKARFFEQLNVQVTRENRRLIERLLAKNDVPLVESPDNVIQGVLKQTEQESLSEGIDLFEDEFGDSVIPKDANDQKKQQQESDSMEYQP